MNSGSIDINGNGNVVPIGDRNVFSINTGAGVIGALFFDDYEDVRQLVDELKLVEAEAGLTTLEDKIKRTCLSDAVLSRDPGIIDLHQRLLAPHAETSARSVGILRVLAAI